MDELGKGLGEDVRPVSGRCNFLQAQGAIMEVIPKVVKFEGDVLSTRAELGLAVGKGKARGVVFVDSGWGKRCKGSKETCLLQFQ
jgi:hypothetical protein